MFESGVAVIERDTAIEALIQLDLGAREAEDPALREYAGDIRADTTGIVPSGRREFP